jgi:DNA-binding transcriptional ArsR family regulator
MDINDRMEIFRLHADFCKILSDANRLLIISELAESETSVNELAKRLGLKQSNVSKHLGLMREHGLVKIRREGSTIFYSLADRRIFEAIMLLRQAQSDLLGKRSAMAVSQS